MHIFTFPVYYYHLRSRKRDSSKCSLTGEKDHRCKSAHLCSNLDTPCSLRRTYNLDLARFVASGLRRLRFLTKAYMSAHWRILCQVRYNNYNTKWQYIRYGGYTRHRGPKINYQNRQELRLRDSTCEKKTRQTRVILQARIFGHYKEVKKQK